MADESLNIYFGAEASRKERNSEFLVYFLFFDVHVRTKKLKAHCNNHNSKSVTSMYVYIKIQYSCVVFLTVGIHIYKHGTSIWYVCV